MLNTFPSKLVGLRLRCHSVHTLPTLSLNPFSCFYIVRECVYPASLPLMQGPGPSGAGRTETEGKKLLCSIRVIHAVLNLDVVTTAYCFGKYCIFHTVHISRSRHSVTQFPSENCHTSSIDPKIVHTSVIQKIRTSEISLVFITVGRFIYFSLADTENLALYSFTKSESCVQRRNIYKFGSCSKTQKYILNHN